MSPFVKMVLGVLCILPLVVQAQVQAPPPPGLDKAFAILEKTETGKKVLDEARAKNLSIIPGKISKTEIVATRVLKDHEEKLDFNVQVLISRDKSPVFQAIDLAHELVHALNPKSNPFDPKLNAVDYIREGIESGSGEARAILQECQVGHELVGQVEPGQAQLIKARCQFVWKTEKDENLWTLSFYHLGKQFDLFNSKLRSTKSDPAKEEALTKIVQAKDPMFTSAAANKPYPLALLDEYVEITQKICHKSLERKIAEAPSSASPMDERCQSLSSALVSH